MVKNILSGIGLVLMLCTSGKVSAQEDSVYLSSVFDDGEELNLQISFQQPESLSELDSIFLAGTDMEELIVTFNLPDDSTLILGKVWIELILHPPDASPTLLSHRSYTSEELDTQGLLSDNEVTASFGFYTIQANYQVAIRFEDSEGNEFRFITKLLVP